MRAQQGCLEVTAVWRGTVIDVAHLGEGGRYTLGGARPRLPFEHPSVPADGLPVAEVRGGELSVRTADAAARRLLPGERARLDVGELALLFAAVEPAVAPPRRLRDAVDWRGGRGLATAAALHAIFLLIAWSAPPDRETLAMDGFKLDDRYVNVMLSPTVEPFPEAPATVTEVTPAGPGGGGETAPTEAVGDAPAPARSTPAPRPTESREAAQARARAAAAMAATALETELQVLANPIGDRAAAALNNMWGDDHGRSAGLGAFDAAGLPGVGPGGPGGGSVAVADLPRRPGGWRGPGAPGPRFGEHRPKGPPPRETKAPPRVVPRDPIVEGSLQKEEIQRVIRRHRNEYQYCYEKQLQTRHDLSGKVVMKFTIGGNGQVIAATTAESTLPDPAVAACIQARMLRWTFPAPRGGGVVVVSYPFLFKPS